MRTTLLTLALASLAAAARAQAPAPAAAPAAPGPVLENARMRVELIGLRRWTVPMIQDSLRVHAPKDSLLSHACAAVLRDKLRFADASVAFYPAGSWGLAKDYVAVTVVEPQDSARVRYRPEPRDTAPDVPAWAPARRLATAQEYAYALLLQRPDLLLGRRAPEPRDSAVRAALPLRAFLRAHRRPADRDRALRALASDGNPRNRATAVLVLANFAAEDRTWWALADALRDPDGRVGAAGRAAPRRARQDDAAAGRLGAGHPHAAGGAGRDEPVRAHAPAGGARGHRGGAGARPGAAAGRGRHRARQARCGLARGARGSPALPGRRRRTRPRRRPRGVARVGGVAVSRPARQAAAYRGVAGDAVRRARAAHPPSATHAGRIAPLQPRA